MATYTATVTWTRGEGEAFTDKMFSRGHVWTFDGGATVRASSSPHVVPRFSDPSGVDPEEAFVASLSSCHMLTFLHMAARRGFVIDRYVDNAVGIMTKTPAGRFWMSEVVLHPQIIWNGTPPDQTTLEQLHHAAHEECFIANSVKTDVRCEPVV